MLAASSPPRACVMPGRSVARDMAVDHAIEHSFVREAVVPERKLLTEALKRGLGAVTVEDVTRESAGASADPKRCRRPQDGDDERDAGPGVAADRLRPRGAGAVAGRWAIRSGHARATGSTTGRRRPSAMSSVPATA